MLAAQFNRDGLDIVDHLTWVFVGDGCLMEGMSHEACSLAGHAEARRGLIALYDDNGISIDGEVRNWFTDDTVARFQAYGWNVIADVDGHDVWALDRAIAQAARLGAQRPRRAVRAHADPVPHGDRQGLAQSRRHGQGPRRAAGRRGNRSLARGDGRARAREAFEPWQIPDDVRAAWNAREAGAAAQARWTALFERYRQAHADRGGRVRAPYALASCPPDWDEIVERMLEDAIARAEKIATRKASQNALNHLGPAVPETAGRFGRPHRQQPHRLQGLRRAAGDASTASSRDATSTTACASSA